MAPRGRSRKKNTRMQAAVEAMQAYGFSIDLILKKLKELLNVYGEENWLFIEENSYKVLLDNILEHVEQEEQQKDDNLSGPSNGVLAHCDTDTEALDTALPVSQEPESASQTHKALDTASVAHELVGDDHLLLPGEGTSERDLNFLEQMQNSGARQDTNVLEPSNKNSGGVDPHTIHSGQPKENIPIQKRKPCYGWISNDDEVKEDCFIKLEPTPLPAELVKLLFGTNTCCRRKTRWDLRPEDLL